MQYRRVFVPGGTFFFTLVTFNRQKIFALQHPINLLRQAFRYTMQRHPFTINAIVILPDHLHAVWTLPESDSDYPMRWRLIKSHFTRHWRVRLPQHLSASRLHKGEQQVWQRRYWEHLIHDEADLTRHVEYIHYNPVKHGLSVTPFDWAYSSFRTYVQQGLYPECWAGEDTFPVQGGA
ncbi:MAG: transposase [Anaerolineae bacterium]|nr:transposase [Anaerolineae bacterium]